MRNPDQQSQHEPHSIFRDDPDEHRGWFSFSNIDVVSLFRKLLPEWKLIFGLAFVFALIGGIYVAVTPHIYEAKMLVAPPPGGGGNNVLSSLRSFARADVSLPSLTDPQQRYQSFQLLLTGDDVAQALLNNYDFKYKIWQHSWDAQHKAWKNNAPFYKWPVQFLMDALGFEWQPPGLHEMSQFISKNSSVTNDLTSGVTTITFDNTDPKFASQFLAALTHEADQIVRKSDIRLMSAVVKDLHRQALTNTQTDQNGSLIDSVNALEIQLTEARVGPEYSVSLLQAATTDTSRPVWPRPLLTIAIMFVLGMTVGMAAVLANIRFSRFARFVAERRAPWHSERHLTRNNA